MIDSAVLRFKYYSKNTTLGGTSEIALVSGNPANYLDYVPGYNEFGATEYASRIDFSGVSSGNLNFTLNDDGETYYQ